MEKKQKIAIKKVSLAIAIDLGSNCPGVIIWGQYNSPKWECLGKCPGASFLVGNCLGPIVQRENCPGSNHPMW